MTIYDTGVGAVSLFSVYVALVVSSMFFPDFIISRLGCKWTMPVAMCGYSLYMGANFYAVKGKSKLVRFWPKVDLHLQLIDA